jgi:hypothetical protein
MYALCMGVCMVAKHSVYGEKQTDVIDMVMKVKTMQAEVCVCVCIYV